jgi:superfamily II DNA/RNA helicase
MRQPQRVEIDSPHEKHASITQSLLWADNMTHKRKLLDHWLRDTTINQAIVFASTQIECDGLANDLQQEGFDAVALHGALSQGLRNRRLMALRQGQVQILVATDVAARGIDVPTITHVFNFGLPMKAEDYTHRIGRTGRAGRDGLAVTFAELRDRRKIFDIESFNRQPIKAEVVPGLEPKQRIPESRPNSFGGRDNRGGGDFNNRDRKFGGGGRSGGFDAPRGNFDAPRGGFADRNANGPRMVGAGNFQNNNGGGFAGRDDRSFAPRENAPRGGFNDRFAGDRNAGAAPRGDFAARKPAFGKSAFSKPAGGGKVFVPRDAQKRFSKNDR